VADAERKAIALGLEQETADMHYLLTDSQAALHTDLNLSKGVPPKSGVEKELKMALWKRRDQDMAVAWIRSHIGIPGNDNADRKVAFEEILGLTEGSHIRGAKSGLQCNSERGEGG